MHIRNDFDSFDLALQPGRTTVEISIDELPLLPDSCNLRLRLVTEYEGHQQIEDSPDIPLIITGAKAGRGMLQAYLKTWACLEHEADLASKGAVMKLSIAGEGIVGIGNGLGYFLFQLNRALVRWSRTGILISLPAIAFGSSGKDAANLDVRFWDDNPSGAFAAGSFLRAGILQENQVDAAYQKVTRYLPARRLRAAVRQPRRYGHRARLPTRSDPALCPLTRSPATSYPL